MRLLYHAQSPIDAHLLRHWLEDAGIPAFIGGELLTGAIGELPLQGLVAVWVPDAAWPAAQARLDDWPGLQPVDPDDAAADPSTHDGWCPQPG